MNEFKVRLQNEYKEFNKHVKKIKTDGKFDNYYKMYDKQKQTIGRINTKYEKVQKQWLNGVSVFLITKDGKIIFEKRQDTKLTPNAIDICSGHIDNEETPIQAAYREMKEELGIEIQNIDFLKAIGNEVPLIFQGNRKFFIQFYIAILKKDDLVNQEEEVKDTFRKSLKDGFELIRNENTKFPYKGNEAVFEYIFKLIEQYHIYTMKEEELEI